MKNFFRPTKDKIIFTFVIPSYLFFGFDFETGKLIVIWLPIPIIFIIGLIFFLAYKMSYDSRINFLFQKIEQEQIPKNPTAFHNILMIIGLILPLLFNYLLACLFFHWYYNKK